MIGSKKRGTFCTKCNSFQTVTILRPQEPSASNLGCEQLRHFSNTIDNIYQTKTLRSLKLGYSSGQGLLPTVCSDEKLHRSVSEEF